MPGKGKPFAKGNSVAKANKGTKKNKTIFKEAVAESAGVKSIEDLTGAVIDVYCDLLNTGDKDDKKFAAKELSKYLFPQKRTVDANVKGEIKAKPDLSKMTNDELRALAQAIRQPDT